MNKVVAVITTYNRLGMLQCCIRKLEQQSVPCDILVINNAATDGTAEYLQQIKNDRLKYYTLDENVGSSGGFSYGVRKAVEHGYEYVWIMDDDCFPETDALYNFLKADNELNGNYGWLSSKCLWLDGTICEMNLQRKTPYTDIKLANKKFIPSQMATFVSLFLRTETVKKYGLPIKEFYIWVDDWEYTRRISRKLPCYVVTNSSVVHAMKNKTIVNITNDSIERLPRYQYCYRNDVYLYRREGVMGWVWLIAKDMWHSVQILMNKKDVLEKLKLVWRGMWKGIWFKPEIEYVEEINF